MRVIAGKYRGLTLESPKGDDIRPTTDRIKEDLFNILQSNYIYPDTKFLDLFSGSGAIGIEAVSRGCERADLIERNPDAVKLIERNIAKLKGESAVKLHRGDVRQFLIATRNVYDIIFMDPPYAFADTDKLMDIIFERKLLSEGGIVVTERPHEAPYGGNNFEFIREKSYSLTKMRFYRVKYGK